MDVGVQFRQFIPYRSNFRQERGFMMIYAFFFLNLLRDVKMRIENGLDANVLGMVEMNERQEHGGIDFLTMLYS